MKQMEKFSALFVLLAYEILMNDSYESRIHLFIALNGCECRTHSMW